MDIYQNVGYDKIPKLVECFMFNDELKMLDFKLKEIGEYVDHFVLVETKYNWLGDEKKIYFEENKQLFKDYLHKIQHVIIDEYPEDCDDVWAREAYQRNAIQNGLDELNLDDDDVVVIEDCDEIFDINAVNRFRNQSKYDVMKLIQDLYFYNLENRFPTKFPLARIAKYKKVKEIGPQNMRASEFPILEKGGWHFSYFFNIDRISHKIKTYAHQEFNEDKYTNLEHIKKCIEEGNYLFDDTKLDFIKIEDNNYLPKNYLLLKNGDEG
jgi:beta-1,4-mannosyl-glycoprotein beta-1,4-N-acetylglucosaminyltransferase